MSGDAALVEKVKNARADLVKEIDRRIVGQQDVIDQLLVALLAGGHVLLVGVPGLAKTLLVKTLAGALSLDFGRIQFTPDLMPTDITGTDILEETEGRGRHFRFVKGPLFCNLLLADEINRTPPKTQAALLEAMQELAVTAGGQTYKIDKPFMVFATQNPIEQAGTYPLPEAQLDRFMLQVDVGYPTAEEEIEIVRRTTVGRPPDISPMLDKAQVLALQEIVPRVPAADHIIEYAVRLVRRTRPDDTTSPKDIQPYIAWGAGPRAAQMLVLAAKARTLLRGRFAVESDDVAALAPAVLRHRLVTSFGAEAEGVRADELIRRLIETTGR
ncbi:MAG: MoxR family ATPase [Deltaproteobacteria bacterium]|nr:MoxR family ATPase [Deltaproteobacteria bacterium]